MKEKSNLSGIESIIKGPYLDKENGLYVGYNSVLEGNIYVGSNVHIGNGSYIVSKNSDIMLLDNVRIGNMNTIKESDDLKRNNNLDIIVNENTQTKNGVTIENNVEIGKDCYIGTGAIIGRNVKIGNYNRLNQGTNIAKNTTIGDNNEFYFCTIGSAPQGLKYEDKGTGVIIGDNNQFREYVVVNRGTLDDTGYTKIGNGNFIFSHVHIGHDCKLGDHNEIISYAALAGHVIVDNHVRISGQSGIVQCLRVGSYSFVAGQSAVRRDVLPFSIVQGNPAELRTINKERLKRIYQKEFKEKQKQVREAFNLISQKALKNEDLSDKLRELATIPALEIADFIDSLPKGSDFLRYRISQ